MTQGSPCSEKTKAKIAFALKTLMNNESFDKITVSDITEECKIHRQTFYYHFQDRYELLDWLIYNELLKPLITDFNLDNMFDKLLNMFETMKNDDKFYHNALKINGDDLTRYVSRVASEQFTEVMKRIGEENGTYIDKEHNIIISEFFGYGISGVVMNWVQRGMRESPKEMTNKIKKLVDICKQIAVKRT